MSSESKSPVRKEFNHWRAIAILALVALVVSLLWRPIRLIWAGPALRNNVNSSLLGITLNNYAADKHTLPAQLDDLVPVYMDAPGFRYTDPESLRVYDWLYFPPTERSPLTKDYILVAQPCPDPSGLRLILRAGRGREWIEEVDYRRLIKAQIDVNAAPIPNLKLP